MTQDISKLDTKEIAKLVDKLIKEEKESFEKRKAALQPKPVEPKKTVGFFEHAADVIVQWLLRKFFPTKVVVPKEITKEVAELRQSDALYKQGTKNLTGLLEQADYAKARVLAEQLNRYRYAPTPELLKALKATPDVRVCDHRKGFRWKVPAHKSMAVSDYNIWDHTFIDGRREIRCLNHCGWKSEPGDANWPVALLMKQSTTNKSTASERPTLPSGFDPKLSIEENWDKAGYERSVSDDFGSYVWVKKKVEAQ